LTSSAGQIDEAKPEEAKKRAVEPYPTMIGALTVSRVVTDQALSDTILRNAEDSITGRKQ